MSAVDTGKLELSLPSHLSRATIPALLMLDEAAQSRKAGPGPAFPVSGWAGITEEGLLKAAHSF